MKYYCTLLVLVSFLGVVVTFCNEEHIGKTMIKIGHRGACGYEPENTLRSFAKAITLGVDIIELDVHVCKSGEVVVIHYDKVDYTTNGNGYVYEKTLDELQSLDAGQGEIIPTLEEVLNLIDRQVKVNIELKKPDTVQSVAHIIERYVHKKGWSYDDFLVSSFNHYALQQFHALLPQVDIGALLIGIPIGFADFAQKVNASIVVVAFHFINQDFVDDAHNREMKVFVFTVNDKDDIQRIKALGVDGIISDYPDRL